MYSFLSRKTRRDTSERGFSIVELTVVIIIIGILSAIAVPMYLDQRASAVDTTVASDVKNMGNEVESLLSSYPDGNCISLGTKAVNGKYYYPLNVYTAVATSTTCSGTLLGTTNVFVSSPTNVITIPSTYNNVNGTLGYAIKGTNTNGKIAKATGFYFYSAKGGLQ